MKECNCGIASSEFIRKSSFWQAHEKDCPVWKNGRINLLESAMLKFVEENIYKSNLEWVIKFSEIIREEDENSRIPQT